jgi:hypothetical protein
LPCRKASISDLVRSSEADKISRFLGGESRGIDLEDFSDCIAMSPSQDLGDPASGRQWAGSRDVKQ